MDNIPESFAPFRGDNRGRAFQLKKGSGARTGISLCSRGMSRTVLIWVKNRFFILQRGRPPPRTQVFVFCRDAYVTTDIVFVAELQKSDRIHSGKQLLIRIVAMLTRLVERFDPDEFRVRQNEPNA
jgi:hypothetical protein